MFDIHPTSIQAKVACFLLLICFAVAVEATTSTARVKAIGTIEANSTVQTSSTPVQLKGKVNGKIVFYSDRKTDGDGFRIWTMNPDGSNPTQLTYISSRDPNVPSYRS